MSSAPSTARGFNFTAQLRGVCADVVARVDELRHVRLDQVALCFSQTRSRATHGVQATLTPLRFEGGATTTIKHGRRYGIQPVVGANGQPMLYILSIYLPRFMDRPFRDKLVTVFHELWHISPEFNGDLRRHPGRYYAHSESRKSYDDQMEGLVRRWLESGPPEPTYAFLRLNFGDLERIHGRVYGSRLSRPKLIPLPDE